MIRGLLAHPSHERKRAVPGFRWTWHRSLTLAALLCLLATAAGAGEVVLFALNDNGALESLRLHGDRTTAVSPQWYAAAADGSVIGVPSPKLLEVCRELNIPVTPTVMNRDFSPQVAAALMRSREARRRFARELLARAKRHGYRGYVLDFENLTPDDPPRNVFTHFVGELRAAFHPAGLSLGVAIPAPSARNQRLFDYRALAWLADRVVLMAYDQHTRFSQPGPIAGFGWVETSVRDLVRLMPASQLLLGVAFYHRNWGESGATSGSYNDALVLQKESGADWQWDDWHRAHWFGFTRAGRLHTVWVEDARSVAEKLALARKYKLAGVAGWRLGQEDPRIWVMLREFGEEGVRSKE